MSERLIPKWVSDRLLEDVAQHERHTAAICEVLGLDPPEPLVTDEELAAANLTRERHPESANDTDVIR